MSLSDEEVERYARHIVLREVGGTGQAKLRARAVLVVGAGGLGSPVLLYLAAAGVGTIGIADFDTVSLSNLQRQIAHATNDVGRPKTDSARDAIKGDQSRREGRAPRVAHHARQRAGADFALRHRRRRIGQFRDALSDQRRLLLRAANAYWSRRRSPNSTASSPLSRRMTTHGSLLSLPVSRSAAARHGAVLLGDRRAGRGRRRDGHACRRWK